MPVIAKLYHSLFSLCAAGLPSQQADSETVWDLSNILIDGQPVQRATVVAWLNSCYQIMYTADYESQEAADNPARTFEGLYRLLAFADAVDSIDGVLQRMMADVSGLQLHAQLGEQQLVLCPGEGNYLIVGLQLCCFQFGEDRYTNIGEPAASSEQAHAFKQQVAAQTEQLLWLTYKMQLEALLQRLHAFVQSCCLYQDYVLRDMVDAVFTPRVLEAAGASGMAASRQALVDSVLMQQVVFRKAVLSAQAAVLKPINLSSKKQELLQFEATVRESSLFGIPTATNVRVELDLFGASTMQVNDNKYSVRLYVGDPM
ncbi:hypothetical protein OEZ85_005616 [Tetradesmus obliquus]|uniref:SMP-LTD domain-containing protein n=1 Tax=Tetradesmus obliquus TaxID=3088 RepID=A0ABY8UG90_TETOB|nr:hypothetical protein OEZ85_005616 [Tetradesmus obliquus]